ncbi:MAG TPA: ABC-type transport auxiliary lipoprotein family protein [Kofleriaceae bacterium]|nr:ABC-type transport auxiliary lipoprotein family protein [Kofleriaceae bacterium]
MMAAASAVRRVRQRHALAGLVVAALGVPGAAEIAASIAVSIAVPGAALATALAGCALTSKTAPPELRYFSPEPEPGTAAGPRAAGIGPRTRLRLGRVTASDHLRYRIARRESPVALELYETLRWTEQPHDYVRRSLGHALFDARPFEQAVSGASPALDVEVTAFDDVVRAGRHAGRVQLNYQLHDERVVLAHGVITVERDAQGPAIETVVVAIGQAMEAATAEIADRVSAQLSPAAQSPP